MLRQLCIAGPLPPPAGGMANQTEKLAELLRSEGLTVGIIQTNAPYQPAWVSGIPVLRALFRLLGYWATLRRELTPQVQLLHIMANSGWSWHLFAVPAILIARQRRIPVVLNYRGGYADSFFAKSWDKVSWALRKCAVIVVPSTFLQQVFNRYGMEAVIVPNVLDTSLFVPQIDKQLNTQAPHLIVTRNLEQIYDVATVIRAFAKVQQLVPQARLTIAGTGPELSALQALVRELNLNAVTFCGRLTPPEMAALYQSADVMLNGSLVDNTPNSLIEAMASAVPIVSTNSGGIPQLVTDGIDALLVEPQQPEQMADQILKLLQQPQFARELCQAGLANVARFSWPRVWTLLQQEYLQLLPEGKSNA
jgi:glycosyltransferase involved in cell wall biosynthesis